MHPIVRQIIDRDCHVSMSAREVVRYVISKLTNQYATFRELSKADRRKLVADCVAAHRANLELYVSVMRGTPLASPKKSPREHDPPSSLTGKEVIRLMRKHRKRISSLACRMGVTQKRIRQVREQGLQNGLAVRDWLEAITGVDPGPIPELFRIRRQNEECDCCFCGCPLYVGDDAFEYVGEAFCSITCCRHSRGWK
jgi:hypothetical protein